MASEEHQLMLDAIDEVGGKVDAVASQVEDVKRDLEFHVAEGHSSHIGRAELDDFMRMVSAWIEESRTDRKSLRESQETMLAQHTMLADLLLGKPERDFDGEIIRTGGIREIVESYSTGSKGFRVSIPWAKLSTVVVASITTSGLIIVALIESFSR